MTLGLPERKHLTDRGAPPQMQTARVHEVTIADKWVESQPLRIPLGTAGGTWIPAVVSQGVRRESQHPERTDFFCHQELAPFWGAWVA